MEFYRTIVADPPWKYKSRAGEDWKHGSAVKYSVLSTKDICALPIKGIADKNSVLFLWSTVPMLEDALQVLRAWGYRYKTAIFWRKIMSMGMGWWFRGQIEICLLGIRGKVKAFKCQKANFIQSKARGHSQKPEEFFDLIEPVSFTPRIELFARQKRKGWDVWGNEIESDIDIKICRDHEICAQ